MRYFFYILFSLLLFVFGQTTQSFVSTAVQLNQKTDNSNVDDKENYEKRNLLHSEIARTCNFEKDFVSYWERDGGSLVKMGDEVLDVVSQITSKTKIHILEGEEGDKWTPKLTNNGYSTFFPKSWKENKVLNEISNAYKNKELVTGNTWRGFSTDGKIEIWMYLDKEGNITSAFPKDF